MTEHPVPLACVCRAGLWRCVFAGEQLRGFGERVVACMQCGTVGAIKHQTEPIPYDPHDASRVVGLAPVELSPAALAWLGAWPRRVGDPEPDPTRAEELFFLPAALRCDDPEALARAEASARATSARTARDRLCAAGVPEEPPPGALPPGFWQFKATWEAGRLAEDTPIEEVFARASPIRRPAAWFVRLPERDAMIASIAALCGDADRERRRVGLGALPLLKLDGEALTIPEPVVRAAAVRARALRDAGDAAESQYLTHVMVAHDPAVEQRLRGSS
jgi:hypothetical protein